MISLRDNPPVYLHTYTTTVFVHQLLYLDEYPAN